jgi:transcriptional regulator with XRE-family HTH domain
LSIGARIKAARKAAQLTQEEVARRTQISLNAYSAIERGTVKDPHLSSLSQIANAVGVRLTDLLESPTTPEQKGSTPESGTELEDLSGVLERLGSSTTYLADAELADKLQEVTIPEALAIIRAAQKEAALLGPELKRLRDAEPRGSVGYTHANLLLETAGVRGLAIRFALRAKLGSIPVSIAGRSKEREELEEEAEELDRTLALAAGS